MQEERIKSDVTLIKVPNPIVEEDRGFRECCDPELVLASNTNTSWKNDITPVWLKLYSSSDEVEFILRTESGQDTIYQPDTMPFPNDQFSKYAEIHWKDVLAIDGVGCYKIIIAYNVGGVTGEIEHGEYELKRFSIENALGTARLKAVFNHFHEIDQINFKGANVNGTIRFYGFIGNRQPNKEIDTLVYSNREIKNVVVENLNSYELKTDPLKEQRTTLLTDLYLLSEVELYASDHNAHNHTYKILDIPVYLKETEELEYKEFGRGANVNAKLWDKFRNKRTYYS